MALIARARPRTGRLVGAAVLLGALCLWTGAASVRADPGSELSQLSLEELMELEVTSVAKRAQKLSQAPAAVTVLTGEDLRRSGHQSIPEALRMVPGLHVARIDANMWAITARGFNGRFANKLLVLIDGRSVYTPLFSGVYWAVQDVPLEDVERIEVVRGPGGTLWGANAVNGVINIITKSARDTQGLLVSAGGGTHERVFGTLRYGGEIGDDLAYRVYAKGFDRDAFLTPDNDEAHDGWDVARGGVRLDWSLSDRDSLTVQGDYYYGDADQGFLFGGKDRIDLSGGNLLARWNRSFADGSRAMLQAYYDRTERQEGLAGETRDTLDLELQRDHVLASWHQLTWGLNYRFTTDRIENTVFTSFDPDEQSDHLVGGFLQSQLALIEDRLGLTVGTKLEYNEYSGFEYQPSVRLLWTPSERHSVWSAVSRAVRTPSRADHTVSLLLPSDTPGVVLGLENDGDMDSEELTAYEIGYRGFLRDNLTLDAATFFFDYADLRSVELTGAPFFSPSPVPGFVQPATFGNRLDGKAYGVEVETTWRPFESWQLSAGWTLFKLQLDKDRSSTDPIAERNEDDSPAHQIHLRSLLDLPGNLELDAALYYVGDVDAQLDAAGKPIRAYWRGDLRLGWNVRDGLELSLVGQNLFDHGHGEYGEFFTVPSFVPRSFFARIVWRY